MTNNSHPIKQYFYFFVVSVALLYVVVVTLLVLGFISNHNRAEEGQRALHAICVLKKDYETRLQIIEKFIRDNPNGIPGISRGQLEVTKRNLEQNVEALRAAECPA